MSDLESSKNVDVSRNLELEMKKKAVSASSAVCKGCKPDKIGSMTLVRCRHIIY